MPKVSVIMPVYNAEKYLEEAINSVINQTMSDWDFWIINEPTSTDQTEKIARKYVEKDTRFHYVENEKRLGLAESLNEGFRRAQGEYLARLDADDLAHPTRFEKQVKLMDENPDVGICGSYQHHFGEGIDFVHMPPISSDACRARLLFNCDLCHSTLMIRRETIFRENLFFDSKYYAEDFELWCRAMMVTQIVNIPEILGEYRWDGDNITASKKEKLDVESGHLVAGNLKRVYGISLTEEECGFFRGWKNPFERYDSEEKNVKFEKFKKILQDIYYKNHKTGFISDKEMLSSIACKWMWAKYDASWDASYDVQELDQIFEERYHPSARVRLKRFCENNKTIKDKLKKILIVTFRPLFRPFRKRMEGMLAQSVSTICEFVEMQTRESYFKLSEEIRRLDREEMNNLLINQIQEAEQRIKQRTDERIWQAEKMINQTVDGRIWQAEKTINQTVDGRIWQAEKLLYQTIVQKTDAMMWNWAYEEKKHSMQSGLFETEIYDLAFYLNNRYTSVVSAQHVLRPLFQCLPHKSVIDFGCGTGTWLHVAQALGAKEIMGLDGEYVPQDLLMIPKECFVIANLEAPFSLEKKFELAISMEVAEHLSESSANTFVKSLCDSADIVLFSAAHPMQGGDGHINEQPMEYWIEKFKVFGYVAVEIQHYFADDSRIEIWYRQNMVIFSQQECLKQTRDALEKYHII